MSNSSSMMTINNILNTLVPSHSLVGKATIDNNQPTPGYLFVDLQNETLISNEKSQQVLSQLLNRLKKDSPTVKLKSLKCMKHLLLKGSVTFRQDLITCSDYINQCTNFRGTLDPLHGDAPFSAVRKEANEILNLLFQYTSITPLDYQQQQQQQNIGSNSYSNQNNVAQQQQQQASWVGFGSNGSITNAPLPAPTAIDQVKEKINTVKDKLVSHIDPNSSSSNSGSNKKSTQLTNFGSPILESTHSSTSVPIIPIRDGTHLMSSNNNNNNNSGNNDILSDNNSSNNNSTFDSQYNNTEWYRLTNNTIGNQTSTTTIPISNITIFIEYYNQLLRQQQQQTILYIIQLLENRLKSKHWQIRHKTLVLLESIIKEEEQQRQQQYCINYIRKNNDILLLQANSVQKSIRDKSRAILKQLDIPLATTTTTATLTNLHQSNISNENNNNNNTRNNFKETSMNNFNNRSNHQDQQLVDLGPLPPAIDKTYHHHQSLNFFNDHYHHHSFDQEKQQQQQQQFHNNFKEDSFLNLNINGNETFSNSYYAPPPKQQSGGGGTSTTPINLFDSLSVMKSQVDQHRCGVSTDQQPRHNQNRSQVEMPLSIVEPSMPTNRSITADSINGSEILFPIISTTTINNTSQSKPDKPCGYSQLQQQSATR
ncbi:hypothetical protein PPL_12190 [Heterostelium album PN500]|uniref:ENTH domain-containing protein n=1 Tax=Heterostelium pallidum (strain ATCC 26659 / Pp 5 / PN500) TaxID=670386 RepID=D3BLY5_HETP5|nr:hypothetical protein PPL_12190 [Heterostelium album PN500]EFA77586.1 hypothetical protein PPL_12190 [Heterostelium album PN500]|eukprot:XP_020429714.1 hypothetical protein PPL_12190 [Heterostelium album PN500]